MLHANKKFRGMEAEEVKTIDNLPNEILLMVFNWLDAKSLREATLVCKNWNELIGSSASTMKKFKIIFRSSKSFDRNMSYRRKHHNAFIEISDEIFELLDHFDVSRVTNLRSRSYRCDDSKLISILKKMPMLEELEYITQKFFAADVSKMQQVVLRKLKTLNIHSMEFKSLQFIFAQQLKKLTVSDDYWMQGRGKDIEELIKFLGRSENLETLKVDLIIISNIFNSEIAFEFKFNLLSFEWGGIEFYNTNWENFNSFLMSQGSSLKTLNLQEVKIPQLIFTTIFTKLQRLNTLRILASSFPKERQIYGKVHPVFTVTELVLNDRFYSNEAAKGLLGNCPNLKILNIKGIIGKEINFLAEYNRKLETLQVNSIFSCVSDNFRLSNLRSLSTATIDSVDNWISLITKCPKIETVEVLGGHKNKITNDTIDLLVQQASLRVLRLSGGFDFKLIFDKIKTNYGYLKKLELSSFRIPKTHIEFDFPENTSDWIIEKEQKRFYEFYFRV